jgi:ABC-type transport system substrate-binding protein
MSRRTLSLLTTVLLVTPLVVAACGATGATSTRDSARIAMAAPATLDPAAAGDAATSAVISQLFETLTAFDDSLTLRPALAESWRSEQDGRRIVFHLRDGLTFSDGTPLRATDVVRSWRRVIDPTSPSPLATLLLDVRGATAYLAGRGSAANLGLTADGAGGDVIVDLERPASDFPRIVAGPTFGIVPPDVGGDALRAGNGFVASGGYRAVSETATEMVLQANVRYWAGPPAITTVTLTTDLAGASPVDVFERGDVDYVDISEYDARWIGYDRTLGPQLRATPSLSTFYFGFDTRTPPFDDVRVRQAFGAAVDWRRIATLDALDAGSVANSMVPPGIPGRSDRDVLPAHDPALGRRLLAEAGYAGGAGFPDVALVTSGSPYDRAVVAEVRRELGITLRSETMDSDAYFARLDHDPPAIFGLAWIADYPGRNDFLGVLLGSDATNDYGRWRSPAFDAAIADAGAATSDAAAAAAYDAAEDVVRSEVPVIPMSYGTGWALSRDGLLGAGQNGLGSLRLAGLAWDR